MSKIDLTYIASAVTSFARVAGILEAAKKIGKEENYHNLLSDIMYRLDGYSEHCGMGTLWNSMTEKREKEVLVSLNKPDKHPLIVMSDSGGLQVITLGLKVSPEEQIESYKRQAMFSHYAMSMDKMPILVNENLRDSVKSKGNGGQGLKLNHSLKFFVRELRFSAGRESGEKIKAQIDVFKSLGDQCIAKVLVILQGWDIEDYNEYAKGVFSVFKELPEEEMNDYFKYIGGISLGTSGIISYFRMFDLYCRAPIDLIEVPEQFRTLIHILGLGGNNKSGILFALNDNFFGKYVHYTYDSTSLTSASTFGRFSELYHMEHAKDGTENTTIKANTDNLGRTLTETVKKFMAEIQDEFGDIIGKHLGHGSLSRDDFRNRYSPWRDDECTGIKTFEDKYDGKDGPKAREEYLNAISLNSFLHFAIEAKKFMIILDEMKSGDFHSISDNEYRKAMQKLYTLKSYEEYMANREWFKKMLGHKRPSTMTLVDTVQEFNQIINSEDGIDETDW